MQKPVNFETADTPGVINLAPGQPSADVIPVQLLREAADAFLAQTAPPALNYGAKQGDEGFRVALAGLLEAEGAGPVDPAGLMLSGGNSQALGFVADRMTQPGDVVLVEEPAYFLAYQIFRDRGLEVVGVPRDADGLEPGALGEAVQRHRPRLVYTVPSFHNPTGGTMSLARREQLVEMAREAGFLIVADEVYQLLHYGAPPPPALGNWADSNCVLSLGSFSKILTPALRLGWIQAGPGLMPTLLADGALSSGGSFNHFTSHVVRTALESGAQRRFIQTLREEYRRRVNAMDEALRQHLGERARWSQPGGGYFFWLELDPRVDTAALKPRAAEFGTGFMPGALFSCQGQFGHCLRLSFAPFGAEDIRQGVAGLGRLLDHV